MVKQARVSRGSVDRWREIPRRTLMISLLAVFLIFATFGFAGDSMDMAQEPLLRFALTVFLSGSFAVVYALLGIRLRGQWWKAGVPLVAVQFSVMGVLARWLPDAPPDAQMGAAAMSRLQSRLLFDGGATEIALCLAYIGVVFVSISEARRYARTRMEKALLESEMAAAREVQEVILPAQGQKFPGFVVESVYRPAREVGGDFFQVLPDGERGLLIVIGDVSGKGLPAAMLVSMLVGFIRVTADDTHDPAQILRELHQRLMGRTLGGFATALAARIGADGRVTIANAGHLSPYLDGREVELAGALPLGVASGGQYDVSRFELRPGSRLTFLSDGVVEAQNKKGELLGFDRTARLSTETAEQIAQAAQTFGQEDDITVLTVAFAPA